MLIALRRLFASALLLPLVVTVLAAPSKADTAPAGVGTGDGSANVLTVQLGDLLRLGLVSEASSTTIDPVNGTPLAYEQLHLLDLHSSAVPALDGLSVPLVETRTSGAEDRKDTALLDLASLPAPVPGLLAGKVNPATLSSVVSSGGALSSLSSSLDNLAVLGGLLHTNAVDATLGSGAAPTSAVATRGLSLDQLTVLDLGGLLQLLGLSLDSLPVGTLTGLLGPLGVPLAAVNQATGLNLTSVGDLNSTIDGMQTTITGLLANTCTATDPILVLLGLDCSNTTTTLNGVVDALQGALNGVLDVLKGTALLSVEGIQIGEHAEAASTVAGSVASTTASIGHIRIGGVDLGGVDLNAALDQITALATQVTTTINGLLATIDPALGNVISVKLFERSASVAPKASYVDALAAITALQVTVTPPDLCAVLQGLNPATTVAGVIAAAGGQAPAALPTPVADALAALTSTISCTALPAPGQASPAAAPSPVGALTQPLTIKALSVGGHANFVTPVAQTPTTPAEPTLPRTGGDSTLLLLVGAGLAAVAIGMRRLSHRG